MLYSIIFLQYIVLTFSPLIAWFLGLFLLAALANHLDDVNRRLIGFAIVLSGSIMFSSELASSDRLNYFIMYNNISSFGLEHIFIDPWPAREYEFGLGFVFFIFSRIFPDVGPNITQFLSSVLSNFLFFLWLEMYGFKYLTKEEKSLCLATSFLFISIIHSAQLARQMISTPLVLFAVFSKGIFRKIILAGIAVLFHYAALPLYLASEFILRNPGIIKTIFITTAIMLFSIYLPISEGGIYASVPQRVRDIEGITTRTIYSFLLLIIYFIIPYFIPLYSDKLIRKWRYFILSFALLAYLMIPYHYNSIRFTMHYSLFLTGYLLFIGIKDYKIKDFFLIYKFLLIMYITYRTTNYLSHERLWHYFDWIAALPFYYFL